MVTYYECYERTEKGVQLTVYAEGLDEGNGSNPWVEIREPSYPYWHQMFPVVPFYSRKKSYSVFGESLFENNRTLQSATNDLFNHYLDNWNLSIESMIMYEDGTLTNDFIIEPRVVKLPLRVKHLNSSSSQNQTHNSWVLLWTYWRRVWKTQPLVSIFGCTK